jgi:hypothetical protein
LVKHLVLSVHLAHACFPCLPGQLSHQYANEQAMCQVSRAMCPHHLHVVVRFTVHLTVMVSYITQNPPYGNIVMQTN